MAVSRLLACADPPPKKWCVNCVADAAGTLEKVVVAGRRQGVARGVASGVARGVASGVAEGVAEGVTRGVARGVADLVGKPS